MAKQCCYGNPLLLNSRTWLVSVLIPNAALTECGAFDFPAHLSLLLDSPLLKSECSRRRCDLLHAADSVHITNSSKTSNRFVHQLLQL